MPAFDDLKYSISFNKCACIYSISGVTVKKHYCFKFILLVGNSWSWHPSHQETIRHSILLIFVPRTKMQILRGLVTVVFNRQFFIPGVLLFTRHLKSGQKHIQNSRSSRLMLYCFLTKFQIINRVFHDLSRLESASCFPRDLGGFGWFKNWIPLNLPNTKEVSIRKYNLIAREVWVSWSYAQRARG